jgi:hypothetical protein
MRITIHQSYFIPWLGYFSKLAFSDAFIVLDDVHFRKRHYFDRTRIVNMHSEIRWLSLPVGQNFRKRCHEANVRLPGKSYVDKIIRTIELSYAKARWYDIEWSELRDALQEPLLKYRNLVDTNVAIIENIVELLGMRMPETYLSSDLVGDCDDSTERIVRICRVLGAAAVVVGRGMSLEVHDWRRVVDEGVGLYIQDYLANHPVYEQSRRKRAGFQKGLSVIDPILNVGRDQTRSFIVDEIHRPVPAYSR